MGFHRKASDSILNDLIIDSADFESIAQAASGNIDISNNPYKLYRIRHNADTAGNTIPFLYLKKGESGIIGTSGKRLQVSVGDTQITITRLDGGYAAYVDGYKVVYRYYPAQEINSETAVTTLYTLDGAADAITQEVKASE